MNSFNFSQSDNLPSMTIESLAFQTFASIDDTSTQVELTRNERQSQGTNVIATLPLPEQLQFASDWNWSVEDRSVVQNLVSNASELRDSTFRDFTSSLTNIVARTGIRAGDLFGARSLGSRFGVAQDTLKEIFFDGVQNRTFSWEWKFAPRSRQEYDQIRDFIRQVKQAASPTKLSGALFKIPDSFQFSFNGIEIPPIKECACTNITDNYGDSGKVRVHKDGAPAFISLSMTFTEIDINERSDF